MGRSAFAKPPALPEIADSRSPPDARPQNHPRCILLFLYKFRLASFSPSVKLAFVAAFLEQALPRFHPGWASVRPALGLGPRVLVPVAPAPTPWLNPLSRRSPAKLICRPFWSSCTRQNTENTGLIAVVAAGVTRLIFIVVRTARCAVRVAERSVTRPENGRP